MKKTLIFLSAAILSIAVSCKKEVEPQKEEGVRVTVIAGSADAKTSIVDNGTTSSFKWTGTTSGQVHLYENGKEGKTPAIELTENDAKAAISAEFSSQSETGYVYTALIAQSVSGAGNASLPSTQNPDASSFDPTADVLIGKPTESVAERPGTVTMQFGRAVAACKMVLTGFADTDEKVSEIVFTAENSIGGYIKPLYEEGYASYLDGGKFSKITLDYSSNPLQVSSDRKFNAYMLAWAVNTGAFSVKVTTDRYVYTKSVSGSVTFKLDKFVSFTFSLSDAERKEVEESLEFNLVSDAGELAVSTGAKIMILNAQGDTRYAMSSTQNDNNRGQQEVAVNGNSVSSVTGCEIFTLGDGTVDGTYSFYATKSTTPGYIYAASSSANHLKTQTVNDSNGSFVVSISGGVATMCAQGDKTHKYIRHNSASGLFSCYDSESSQSSVSIYMYDIRTVPAVTAKDTSITTAGTLDVSKILYSDSTGETSYTVSGGTLSGNVFSADEPGEYTLTMKQKADDSFKGAVAQATITVTELEEVLIEVTSDDQNKTITVTWLNIEHAEVYTVNWNDNNHDVQAEEGPEYGTYTIQSADLEYDVQYDVYVSATAEGYKPSDSDHKLITLKDPLALEKPQITDLSVDGTSVIVMWDDVPNATSYSVMCGSASQPVASGVGIVEFTDLTAGQYDVKVIATAEGYHDGVSETLSAEVYEKLAAPTGLAVSSDLTTSSSIKVTWNAVSHDDAGYQVAFATGSSEPTSWTDVAAGTTEHSFTGLEPYTKYVLYVKTKAHGYYTMSDSTFTSASTIATCTFTSKAWATGTNEIQWTSGKDGGQLSSGKGVQVTTACTGANATMKSSYDNISKIIVTYCTNASNGAGTIVMQVGTGTEKTFTVTKPSSGGATLRTCEFDYSTAESGQVKMTVNCTTNSIYINGVTIIASE